MMDSASLQQVIVAEIARRGDGKSTPIRLVRQVFTTDGELIGEKDPCSLRIEEIWHLLDNLPSAPSVTDVREAVRKKMGLSS